MSCDVQADDLNTPSLRSPDSQLGRSWNLVATYRLLLRTLEISSAAIITPETAYLGRAIACGQFGSDAQVYATYFQYQCTAHGVIRQDQQQIEHGQDGDGQQQQQQAQEEMEWELQAAAGKHNSGTCDAMRCDAIRCDMA